MLTMAFATVFFALCIFAGVTDLRRLIIPNWVNIAIAVLFVPAALAAGLSLETFGWHVAVGAIAFVVGFILFAFGVFGGGDAKMIPAVLLWMGPGAALNFSVGTALAGGVLAALVIFARKTIPAHAAPGMMKATIEHKSAVPYGVAIAVGAFVGGVSSPLLAELLKNISVFN